MCRHFSEFPGCTVVTPPSKVDYTAVMGSRVSGEDSGGTRACSPQPLTPPPPPSLTGKSCCRWSCFATVHWIVMPKHPLRQVCFWVCTRPYLPPLSLAPCTHDTEPLGSHGTVPSKKRGSQAMSGSQYHDGSGSHGHHGHLGYGHALDHEEVEAEGAGATGYRDPGHQPVSVCVCVCTCDLYECICVRRCA
jgi:hypothetical protein